MVTPRRSSTRTHASLLILSVASALLLLVPLTGAEVAAPEVPEGAPENGLPGPAGGPGAEGQDDVLVEPPTPGADDGPPPRPAGPGAWETQDDTDIVDEPEGEDQDDRGDPQVPGPADDEDTTDLPCPSLVHGCPRGSEEDRQPHTVWRGGHEDGGGATTRTRSEALLEAPQDGDGGLTREVSTWAAAILLFAWLAVRIGPMLFGSRLERGDVADHPVRRRMLDHLGLHPGATTSELARVAGVAAGRATYHLSILEREGVVRSRRIDRRRRFFPQGAPRVDDAELAVRDLALPERQTGRIVAILGRSPGVTLSELARLLKMSPGQTHYHVTKLHEGGLVDRVRRGRRVRHYLNSAGRSLEARFTASSLLDAGAADPDGVASAS